MFKAIVSADTLGAALDSVSVLVDECKIRLDEEGLTIRAVDPANVGMVDLELSATAFESYETDGGVIGVNLDRLEDIVGMADSDQLVHLELDEETRKLHISLDYLKDMDKAIPSDAEVTTELGEEFPVKMHFGYAEGDGHVTFMLAPRIQSD